MVGSSVRWGSRALCGYRLLRCVNWKPPKGMLAQLHGGPNEALYKGQARISCFERASNMIFSCRKSVVRAFVVTDSGVGWIFVFVVVMPGYEGFC